MGDRPYVSRHNLDRAVAVALAITMFAASWFRHATFRSTTYDLGIFEQAVWKLAHGHGATSTLVGWNIFADHLSPILVVFVPLYRLAATPLWFFGAQALALGLGVLLIRPLAAAVGLDETERPWAPVALLIAYVLSPALWNASIYDFHPLTLAVPVLLLACSAALRNNHRLLLLCLLGMVLVRDDLTVAASAIALVGWRADDRRGRLTRAGIAVVGIAWMLLGSKLGSAMGSDRYFANRYGYIGATPSDALHHPWHTLVGVGQHVLDAHNLIFLAALGLPFALLSLGAPAWAGLALFLMLPNMASADRNLQLPNFQYGAPLLPLVLLAAAGGMRRIPSVIGKQTTYYVGTAAALAFAMFGPAATGSLTAATVNPVDARAAIASLRPTDAVATTSFMGAHVADRVTLLPFPAPFIETDPGFPLSASVLATSPSAQRRINVVLVPTNPVGDASPLVQKFIDSVAGQKGFTATTFGTVTVFRRPVATP